MNKRLFLTLLLVVFVLPAGCAKYWYQEGKSFDECKLECLECFQELSKRTDFSGRSANFEIDYMNMCMQAKGYLEVSADELPLDVKRQEPESSFHWRARGVAGTVD